VLFVASDTKASRGRDVRYYALVNDSTKEPPPEILAALEAYEITVRSWALRDEIVDQLAA
jgi:hypothetical protein